MRGKRDIERKSARERHRERESERKKIERKRILGKFPKRRIKALQPGIHKIMLQNYLAKLSAKLSLCRAKVSEL